MLRRQDTDTLAARVRRAMAPGRTRTYWLTVALLGSAAILLILLFGPGRRPVSPPVLRPTGSAPEFTILQVQEPPEGKGEWLTVMALVDSGMAEPLLRQTLDGIIAGMLERYYRLQRRTLRIIWVYLYDRPVTGWAYWRAMAVYTDPRLPAGRIPPSARIGGDAVRTAMIEYDFTNPVTLPTAP